MHITYAKKSIEFYVEFIKKRRTRNNRVVWEMQRKATNMARKFVELEMGRKIDSSELPSNIEFPEVPIKYK